MAVRNGRKAARIARNPLWNDISAKKPPVFSRLAQHTSANHLIPNRFLPETGGDSPLFPRFLVPLAPRSLPGPPASGLRSLRWLGPCLTHPHPLVSGDCETVKLWSLCFQRFASTVSQSHSFTACFWAKTASQPPSRKQQPLFAS